MKLKSVLSVQNFYTRITTVLFLILVTGANAHAQSAMTFSFDGVLTTNDGFDTPVTDSVIFRIGIYNPAENCLLYEESQTQNLTTTNGQFSLAIGSVVAAGKRTVADPNLDMKTVFSNAGQVRSAGANCASGYTPASSNEGRQLRIVIEQIGATAVNDTLASQPIRFAPFAQTADSVQGKGLNELVTKSVGGGANIPQYGAGGPSTPLAGQIWYDTSAGNFKYFDGASTLPLTSGGGSGTVTNVTAGVGLLGGPITTTGTLSVDVGTGPGQIVQLNGSSQLPNVSGANLIGLSGAQLTDASISTAKINDGAVTDAKIVGVSGAKVSGNITGQSSGFTGALAGDVTGAQGTTSVQRIQGRDVANTAPGVTEVLKWNGAQWAPAADAVGTGDITSVTAGTGLSGGAVAGDATLSLTNTAVVAGTYGSANQIASFSVDAQGRLIDANQIAIAITANQIVNGAGQYFSYRPNNISCANGDVLKWNTTQWECATDSTGGAPSWGTITGIPSNIGQFAGLSCANGEVAQFNGTTWFCGTAGEVNTASNSGVGGVGVFSTKTGMNFEFRNINAASSRVSVINDAANNEIDINVNEANLNITNLGGTLPIANTSGTLNVSRGGTGNTSFNGDALIMSDPTGSSLIALDPCNDGIILSDGISYTCYTLPICTTGELLTYDGVTWDCEFPTLPDATVAAKGVVQVGSGLNVSAGVVSVDVGSSANKIVQLDGSAELPSVGGSNLMNVSAERIQGRPVAPQAPTQGQVLGFDGANWRPQPARDIKSDFTIFHDFTGLVDSYGAGGQYDLTPGLVSFSRGATSLGDFITPTNASDLNHPGIFRMTHAATANHSIGVIGCQVSSAAIPAILNKQFLIGGGEITLETVIRHPAAPGSLLIRFGFADLIYGAPVKGLYFEYNGAVWNYVARGSALNTASMGIGITGNIWQKLRIKINPNASNVEFTIIDGGTPYTMTVSTASNIPNVPSTDAMCPLIFTQGTGISANTMDMDYFYLNQQFTTPR